MGLVVYIISFVTAALGFVIAQIIGDQLTINELGNLDQVEINLLIFGLLWFVVCLVIYFGSAQLDSEKWFKLISPSFFLTWLFVDAGIVFGQVLYLLYDGSDVFINGDIISSTFFTNLQIALGPTASVSLGLRSKE